MKLIGLVGYPGVGKDEAAKALVADGWKRLSFADHVRKAALAIDPIVGDNSLRLSELVALHGWDAAKRLYPEVRRLLQCIGTEGGRDIHGYNCWVNLVSSEVCEADMAGNDVVITDVRFDNEVSLVDEEMGLLLWVERPGGSTVNDHQSEQQYEWLRTMCKAEIVNDGDVQSLHDAIRQFVVEWFED